jgi:hypothetical protein
VRKLLALAAAVVAAVAIWVGVTLPPKHLELAASWPDGTVRGILHVHTNRSDGLSSPDEVAADAARAGLSFVVFTDHGDGTRKPDPPAYRAGVLCLDGVEISTRGGHYIAIDMPQAPYPLGGDARDVVEDVRRLGGFGIAAHPDSPKLELQWREWVAPFDAIEIMNPDSSWRVHYQQPGWRPKLRLLTALVDYPVRPAETLAALLQPTTVIPRWDALTHRRRVVALSGADAHAKLAPRAADPGDNRLALPIPSYTASFRMMSVHVRTERAFTGDAAADGAMLVRALRAGHAYSAIDGVATPPAFEFSATNEHGTVFEGDELGEGGPVTLRVRTNAPPAFTTIVHQGSRVLSGDHHEAEFTVQAPAAPEVYWVETIDPAHAPPIAWLVSNPVYVRGPDVLYQPPARPPATVSAPAFDGQSAKGWEVESDSQSLAALDPPAAGTGGTLRMRFGLGGGGETQPYAALVMSTPEGVASADRVTFSVRAERPMRISVQLRADEGTTPRRWERSIYVDTMDRERSVFFDELTPIGATRTWRPDLHHVHAIMFVIETTNTRPGTSGQLWVSKASLQR